MSEQVVGKEQQDDPYFEELLRRVEEGESGKVALIPRSEVLRRLSTRS